MILKLQNLLKINQLIPYSWNLGVSPERKKKLKLVILLAAIWFVVTLPLPWIVNNPEIPESALYSVLSIIGIISIPFVILGIVWTLKPELTT